MKQRLQQHVYGYGQLEAFLATHAWLMTTPHPDDPPPSPQPWRDFPCICDQDECEHHVLYHMGWQDGERLAMLAITTTDLALYTQMGTIGGFTSRRPPRHSRWITAERDALEARIPKGTALTCFLHAWKRACAPDRAQGV